VVRKSLATVSIVCILTAVVADISKADVSMTQHVKVSPSPGEWTRTLRIKGLKMRIDTVRNGENLITIYDLSSGKGYQLDAKRKEIIVADLKSPSASKNELSADNLRRTFKETGKKKEIGSISCDEYVFDLPGPAAAFGHGMAVVQDESGTLCVSQTIPEGIEVVHFVREAIKRGYGLATAPLGPTKTSIGLYFSGQEPNMLIVAGTVQYRTKEIGVPSGSMPTVTYTLTISDIKSDSIPDEVFQIPAWKEKK